VGHGYRFWPAFWLYDDSADDPSAPACSHFEIDISDPGGQQYQYANIYSGNGWHADVPCTNNNHNMPGSFFAYTAPVNLCDGYHKYGLEWNTDRIIWYYDDVPVNTIYNNSDFTWTGVRVVIDQQIDAGCTNGFDAGLTFPQYMKIDYFRYYQLNHDCSSNVTVLNNTDLAAYAFSVKNSITFGNGSNSVSFSSGDVKTFRAVDGITVYGSFTVPLGAEVTLEASPCN
jgi:beta-glucanase (GH16 family)